MCQQPPWLFQEDWISQTLEGWIHFRLGTPHYRVWYLKNQTPKISSLAQYPTRFFVWILNPTIRHKGLLNSVGLDILPSAWQGWWVTALHRYKFICWFGCLQCKYGCFSMFFSPNKANRRKEGKAGTASGNGQQSLLYWDYCPGHGWNRSKFTCVASHHATALSCSPSHHLFPLPPFNTATNSRKTHDLVTGHYWYTLCLGTRGVGR